MLLEMIIILKIFPLDPPDFWERNPDFKFPSCHHFLWNKRVRLSHSDIKSEQSAIWESRTICHCCQNPVQKEYSKTGFFQPFWVVINSVTYILTQAHFCYTIFPIFRTLCDVSALRECAFISVSCFKCKAKSVNVIKFSGIIEHLSKQRRAREKGKLKSFF